MEKIKDILQGIWQCIFAALAYVVEWLSTGIVGTMLTFVVLCLAFVGAIGGVGYCLYYGQPFTAICLLVVDCLAWPQYKKLFNKLNI